MAHKTGTQLGCWIDLPSPQVTDIIAGSGFDYVVLDLEHGIASVESLQMQLMALAGRCASVVRIPEMSEGWIKRVLDSGADAVMVPRVETASDAAEIVQMASFAPIGRRGEGLPVVRASGWGRNSAEYRKTWQKNPGIVLQIESAAGLAEVEAIAATKGVSQLLFGPSDYSASIGVEITYPAVLQAAETVALAGKANGLEVGTISLVEGTNKALADMGYTHIAVASDVIQLVGALDGQISAARDELGL